MSPQDLTVVSSEPLPQLSVMHSAPLPGNEPSKPPTWMQQHPKTRQVVKGVLDTLPVAGGLIAGTAATPETIGGATIPAGALGVGIGRGARDLIAEYLGVDEPTSPLSKGARIALDTTIAAAVPVVANRAKEILASPKASLADVLEGVSHPKKTLDALISYLRSGKTTLPFAQFGQEPLSPLESGVVERYAPNVSGTSLPPITPAQQSALSVAGKETGANAAELSALRERLFPGGGPYDPRAPLDASMTLATRVGPDVDAVKALVAKGVPPSAAVKQVAGNDPTKFGSLMTLYLRSRQVK